MEKIGFTKILIASLIMLCAFNISIYSQEKEYYVWFDSLIGPQNTGLFNGSRYVEQFRAKKGSHKYFIGPHFQKANISYFNQPYYDIDLKYDVFENQLITNVNMVSGSSIIKLIPDEVQAFSFGSIEFIRLKDSDIYKSSESISGFYEIMMKDGPLILYKKHRKTRQDFLDQKIVYSQFKSKNEYYVFFDNIYYQINRKSDWTRLFPGSKNQVNDYYVKNKHLLKTDYDAFILQLARKIANESNHKKGRK